MKVMIVGSGGREHALAWKLSQSQRVSELLIAPGNGGTSSQGQNVPIDASDIPALVNFAQREQIDLTVVGPEVPLVAGLADAFAAAGLRAFGPSAAAAQLEGSKAFAKRFMFEEGIPTGMGAIFDDFETARAYLLRQQSPIVVKASGLAAGKGVVVCSTLAEAETALEQAMVERIFGEAGDEVLIEDCLVGEEASLLAFSDGRTVVPMLPARDYKRIGDGDQGPNTGGMGCYAPSPYLAPALIDEVTARILQPAVDGMHRRGTPYVGILYAGLMLTKQGPRVIEFNCRFGDPETQVLLPLLESDLLDLFLACTDGRLDEVEVRWKRDHAVTLVMASRGYPGAYEKGKLITGVDTVDALDNIVVFHAGTRQEHGRLLSAGGRVLAVTATAPNPEHARERAYAAVKQIRFEGAQYRTDIAVTGPSVPENDLEALKRDTMQASLPVSQSAKTASAYASAGVDIDAGNQAVEMMKEAVRSTYTPAVMADIGLFGGLFSLKEAIQARDPVLVASTDSIGTKTVIAAAMGRFDSIGQDLVNHCVNDILVQGARPLFFLDYFASSKIDPVHVAAAVGGCAKACRAVGCALIGGETAELPGVYQPAEFDLVGAIVGWVERDEVVDGRDVRSGDICLGLPSSGLHTNGYSLARRVLGGIGWETVLPRLGQPLGEVLLAPHRSYLHEVEALWGAGIRIKAMAHITGGGFYENIPRVLPEGVGVRIDASSWEVPSIFRLIEERGQVDAMEMYRVFNMGIGLVILIGEEQVPHALAAVPEAVIIGKAVDWNGQGPRVAVSSN